MRGGNRRALRSTLCENEEPAALAALSSPTKWRVSHAHSSAQFMDVGRSRPWKKLILYTNTAELPLPLGHKDMQRHIFMPF
jgi:hypothetical protein